MQTGIGVVSKLQPTWLLNYLGTLCWKRFSASAAKRVAVTGTEYVLVRLFIPSAFASTAMYMMTSTAGTLGKNACSYGFDKLSGAQSGAVMVAIPIEDLAELEKSLQGDRTWQVSRETIAQKAKRTVKHKALSACHSILNITYQDLSEGSGAFVGSTLASVAFIAYMGPPTLFILPLYFLAEGCTKSVGAFLGKYLGRNYIGPTLLKPVLTSTWKVIKASPNTSLEEIYDLVHYELEKISLVDDELEDCQDLLNSWYLFKEKPTEEPIIVKQDVQPVYIEDYKGERIKNEKKKGVE